MFVRVLWISSLIACGTHHDQDDAGSSDSGVDVATDVASTDASDAADDAADAMDAMGPPAQPKWQAKTDDVIVAVTADGQGGAYVVGDSTTLQGLNGEGVFFEHYDAAGKLLFRRDLGNNSGIATTRAASVALLPDGSAVFSLVTNGSIDFPSIKMGDACGQLGANGTALILMRLGTDATCLWAKRYNGYTNVKLQAAKQNRIPVGRTPTGFAVAVPPLGAINFEGTQANSTGTVLGRFTTAGTVQAVQLVDDVQASGMWIIESVASDASGNIYVGGRTGMTLALNMSVTTGHGVFVAKYSPQLNNVWERLYGGSLANFFPSGAVDEGTKIDINGNTIGLIAPVDETADFGVAKITPTANNSALAIARILTSNGDGQAATGAYSNYNTILVRSNGVAFGSNGTLLVTFQPGATLDGMKYAGGVTYAGLDSQLKPIWVKNYDGGWPTGIGFNPMQQTAVIAGTYLSTSIDFGLGPLMTNYRSGFVVALGAP